MNASSSGSYELDDSFVHPTMPASRPARSRAERCGSTRVSTCGMSIVERLDADNQENIHEHEQNVDQARKNVRAWESAYAIAREPRDANTKQEEER
jgi:hypothetical protein